jgi:hypothetical protein
MSQSLQQRANVQANLISARECFLLVFVLLVETGSHYVAQASPELSILFFLLSSWGLNSGPTP